jgi:hypothetical protein
MTTREKRTEWNSALRFAAGIVRKSQIHDGLLDKVDKEYLAAKIEQWCYKSLGSHRRKKKPSLKNNI